MAVAETTYLYALAGLSVSFVGFSTLVIVFRQSVGGRLSSYGRRAATGAATAGFIRLFLLPQLCAALALALGALGRPLGPGVAPYASALTLILVTSGLAFLFALRRVMLPQLPKGP
jgi:hypothetical protein